MLDHDTLYLQATRDRAGYSADGESERTEFARDMAHQELHTTGCIDPEYTMTAGASRAVRISVIPRTSSRRRMASLQLRREVDMQARAGTDLESGSRDVDAQCYDGKADAETDAGRIFDAVDRND